MRGNSWVRYFSSPRPSARLLMLAFPHAGGGPSEYASWPQRLPGWMDFCAFAAPGRDTRHAETPWTSVDDLAAAAAEAVSGVDHPLLLFGHSLGAWIAYEAACRLARAGRAPAHLFVSGAPPPHLPRIRPSTDDAASSVAGGGAGAAPPPGTGDAEAAAVFQQALQADLIAASRYRPRGDSLAVPATVLLGLSDPAVVPAQASRWSELAAMDPQPLCFPGGHFFVRESRDAVIAAVTARLRIAVNSVNAGPKSGSSAG